MKHEDNRRILTEFGNGKDWKVCKVIQTKEDCVLGKHYHREKDESFMLVRGKGEVKITKQFEDMELFKEYYVPAGTIHEFYLTKGSILVGLCSKEFNPNDEISSSN